MIAIGLTALLALTLLFWVWPKVLRHTQMGGVKAVVVAQGLAHPWSLAFLPDGRMLVTERPGRLRVVAADGSLGTPIDGLPEVWAEGEGGLLDVALSPRFAEDALVYFSYSEPAADGTDAAGTAVARARLDLDRGRLDALRVIYREPEKRKDIYHFGSRLLFAPDGRLFVSLGDRWARDEAQNPGSSPGKILRLEPDGGTPADNPFVQQASALPQVWTLGHRNVQGLAFHPVSGALWATEHGPKGGDELNVIVRGHNYGWPVITYGCEYNTCAKIGAGTHQPGLEQPVHWWGPRSLAPSGMAFLTSERYPGWKGQLFVASLTERALLRLELDGTHVAAQHRMISALDERIRDVRQGPDGWLYVLTDSPEGRILRLER